MYVKRFYEPGDVIKVLEEALWSSWVYVWADELVYLVDVVESIWVDPDDRDDMKELSSFIIVSRSIKYRSLHILEERVD